MQKPSLPIPERIESDNVLEVMTSLGEACGQLAPTGPLALDFAALKSFDSSALSMLLELSRRRGAPVLVLNPPPKLAELAELYGVADMLFGAENGADGEKGAVSERTEASSH